MEFTIKDRLFLINQYEILKLLDKENEQQYSELIEILQSGYEIFYSDTFEWLSEAMPQAEGKFVLDILSIYRAIENYKEEHPEDGQVRNHVWGHFQGFDGNDEGMYRAFTLFLIETQGKFDEQVKYKGMTDSFNTHGATLYKYRSMVERWLALDRDLSTRENILSVLEVQ